MPHAAHTLLRGIRIDVEPANADHPSIEPRPEQPFARSIEAIRAADPSLDEPTDQPQSGLLTFGEQRAEVEVRSSEWEIVALVMVFSSHARRELREFHDITCEASSERRSARAATVARHQWALLTFEH